MHEINKETLAKRDDLILKLERCTENVTNAEAKMNEAIAELNEEIQKYNNTLKAVDELCTYVVGEIADYMGNKSEGWKEENYDSYSTWEGEWSGIDLNVLDLIDEPSIDEMNHARELANLPLAPE